MLPRIAITEADDARTVFDALNAYYAHHYDTMTAETKTRVIDLLVLTHMELTTITERGNDNDR